MPLPLLESLRFERAAVRRVLLSMCGECVCTYFDTVQYVLFGLRAASVLLVRWLVLSSHCFSSSFEKLLFRRRFCFSLSPFLLLSFSLRSQP